MDKRANLRTFIATTMGCALVLAATRAGADEPPRRYRNNGMRIAGIVITTVASAALVAGIGTSVFFATGEQARGDFGGIGVVVVGLPLVGGSIVMAAVGVPLWVVGAKPASAGAAWVPSPAPLLGAGNYGGSLKWSF